MYKTLHRAEESRQLAQHRTLASQQTQVIRYNDKHRQVNYCVGDLVLVWSPVRVVGRSEKLLSRYFGPYRITQPTSDVNYEIERVTPISDGRSRNKDIVHVSRMKPYTMRSDHDNYLQPVPSPSPEEGGSVTVRPQSHNLVIQRTTK